MDLHGTEDAVNASIPIHKPVLKPSQDLRRRQTTSMVVGTV